MSTELLVSLATFAFVSSVTPGPNNAMLLASGTNFGFQRSVPHILGSATAMTLMITLAGLGLGPLLDRSQTIAACLRTASVAYLVWFAWRLAWTRPALDDVAGDSPGPLSFTAAMGFQAANPKGWLAATAASAAFVQVDSLVASVFLMALVFGLINLPAVSLWALFGAALQRFLRRPRTVRRFNIIMAVLLICAIWPLISDLVRL